MSTTTEDRATLGVDSSLLAALDEVQVVSTGADTWVPPSQRRLSSAPPLATSLPIRGAAAGVTEVEAAPSRFRMPAAPTTPAPAPVAVVKQEITFEQVRQEGLEWLRDLARRKA